MLESNSTLFWLFIFLKCTIIYIIPIMIIIIVQFLTSVKTRYENKHQSSDEKGSLSC